MENELIVKGRLFDEDDLDFEYRLRKKEIFENSIEKGSEIPKGWEVKKEYKTKTRIQKEKDIGTRLEDYVWRLFYEIGVQKLSSKYFTINLKTRQGQKKTRQIDVLAIDEDIVFIVECKSQVSLGKKSLKKDIAEFSNNLNDMRIAIRKLIDNQNLRFVFVFATENIIWDENDKLDAKESNLLIWDEYDMLALHDLAKIAGEGAKYQIYNRVFYQKKIKKFEVKIPALKAKMGGIPYYLFSMCPEHLLKISYVHQRTGRYSFLDLTDSYQRIIKKTRIDKIEQFIENGGFFPGNIIVNFTCNFTNEEAMVSKDKMKGVYGDTKPVLLTLPPYYGCAWIIDGQHRLYGYADTEKKRTETIPVVAFAEIPSDQQTKIFVDINKNQKSIEPDLLWDLYEDLYVNAQEDKEKELFVISKIGKLLNDDKDSPFFGHISIPKEQNEGNISLTTICTSLSQQKIVSKSEDLLFYNSYDETISFAFERIKAFFDVFKTEMIDEWNSGDKHYVRTNSAVVVLMGIFRDLIECSLSPTEIKNVSKFKNSIRNFLEPLILHLWDCDNQTIGSYRGAGGAGQKSRQIRAELTQKIIDAELGFRSIWKEKYDEGQKKEDKFAKQKSGINYYLLKEEGDNLEFKGSLKLDLNRLYLGDGKEESNDSILEEGVLRSIVSFLNTKGGEVVIGILEKHRFEKAFEEKGIDIELENNKYILGIDIEYNKDEWDGYLQRLIGYIEDRISPDVIDAELVKIDKYTYEDKNLCLITIRPAESKQYLNGKFFIRRGNKTACLEGQQIDKYWSMRP